MQVASALTYRGGDASSFTGWTSSNGLTNTLSYDGDGRLTGISVPGVQSLGFGYDAADRITRITNGRDASLTQTFQYDSVYRLTSATSTANSEGFQYDTNGNRTSHVINGVTLAQGIDPGSNRLVSTNTQALGYDANGNLTTVDGAAQYHYDAFNRMDSATNTTYYVNPEGQRLRKVGALDTIFFAPDRGGPLLAEYANGGWVDYVWIHGRLIGRVSGGQVYAIHADQVGRPEVATNASRSIVWSAENFAFDRQVVTEGFKLNLGFPGQYFDDETKTWNNGFRDYRADLGRYVESDPVGLMAGANTYTYVGGNPMSLFDIWGLTQEDIDCMLALAKRTETDLKFPKKDPVVQNMATHIDSLGNEIVDVGEYNAINGKMYLSSRYLKTLSGDMLVELYDTIVHEALHKTRGPFSGLGEAHRDVYQEANKRSNALAGQIKSGGIHCGCAK
ncbi:hypothetical protein L2Y94_13415 [Luteibacter aegosomatis]|uniref:RHS repeat domain-containing protein n=1 Tax=Luteibacter aegosomatis TaxID=2911537 RepID=UPI001FF8B3D7|nr:RHS repeat-associated core domain-containing protein [Luteibacter aegosomatis]UPG84339.1 hypothetical protein L2Y94_13415 [Luteibacter aegosomatis]